jgi:circadian clock protein KaiC
MDDSVLANASRLLSTGVDGLDDVLGGGLLADRLSVIEGPPGAGTTTIALQFLMEGVSRGEPVLYVTLSETESELRGVALSHGWDLDNINMREMLPTEDSLQPEEQYTMFHPSEVELSETTLRILKDVEAIAPKRIVFDSLSELRLLSGTSLR